MRTASVGVNGTIRLSPWGSSESSIAAGKSLVKKVLVHWGQRRFLAMAAPTFIVHWCVIASTFLVGPQVVDVRVFSKDTFELGRGKLKVGEGFAVGLYSPERSLVDMIRLRHREGSDIAWEALRRWLGRRGAKPAALIEMAKSLHGAERAVRNALEIVL